MTDKQENKIHIDSDWKAQAQAEKQKMAEKSKAQQDAQSTQNQPDNSQSAKQSSNENNAGKQGMPPANFETLLSTIATQALFAMGAIADPRTGKPTVQLDLAKHHIDMLGVIEEKTKDNLQEHENELLSGTLQELRNHFVQVAQGQGNEDKKTNKPDG